MALDAKGGRTLGFSPRRAAPRWHARHVNDRLLSLGWETALGHITNQWVTLGFSPSRLYRLFEVIIDPEATGGDPSDMDLKDFQIRVSSTGSDLADFTTINTSRCERETKLQPFRLPVPVLAKYIELLALDNYGSRKRMAVAEFEAVANVAGLAYPSGVAIGKHGNMYVVDTGNDRIQELSPTSQPLHSWGTKGSSEGAENETSGSLVWVMAIPPAATPALDQMLAWSHGRA